MAAFSQGQPASGSPLESFGGASPERLGGAPGVVGALGSGAGPARGGAGSVGGTPGVSASGLAGSGWSGRPCSSYPAAGPACCPPAWLWLNWPCTSSSLACACSAIFFALSRMPMSDPPWSPPALDSTRPTAVLQGVGEAPRHLRILARLPQRDDQQLAARAVPQAHEGDVAVAHVDRPALGRGAWRRLLADPAGGPGARHAAGDLGPRVERPADALPVALDRVVGDGDERRAHGS